MPFKIQIFLWQLFQDSILTRDVMRRRNWLGNPSCSFCDNRETSQHLFFTCPIARLVWWEIFVALNLVLHRSISNMFGNWLLGIDRPLKTQVLVGVCALCWWIWTSLTKHRVYFPNMDGGLAVDFWCMSCSMGVLLQSLWWDNFVLNSTNK